MDYVKRYSEYNLESDMQTTQTFQSMDSHKTLQCVFFFLFCRELQGHWKDVRPDCNNRFANSLEPWTASCIKQHDIDKSVSVASIQQFKYFWQIVIRIKLLKLKD